MPAAATSAPSPEIAIDMIGAGAICLVAALWFYGQLPEIRRVIRPIYRELGILPALPETPPE